MAHIALFGKLHWKELKESLGFARESAPHATTISRVLAGVPFELLQDALIAWIKGIVGDRQVDVSVDGKWARQPEDACGSPLGVVNVLAVVSGAVADD